MEDEAMAKPDAENPTRPPVVVAGLWYTGSVLMRCFARRGVPVYGIDCVPSHVGYGTRHGPTFECPDPEREPEAWCTFMLRLREQIGTTPVLMSAADVFTLAIAKHADRLSEHFVFRPEGYRIQARLATKLEQYRVAAEQGMPIALTRVASSLADVEDFATQAKFPCLLKPRHARSWLNVPREHSLHGQKTIVAATPAELLDAYRLAEPVDPNVVLQEIIAGPDSNKLVYLSCWGEGGRRLGSCLVGAYRAHPANFGSCSTVEPVRDPETEDLCERFLGGLRYSGFCEIELKRDTRDGAVKMIEANPRYSTTSDAAQYGGVDIGWLHYLDLIGEKVEPLSTQRWNWRHVHVLREVGVLLHREDHPRFTWREWFRSLRPPVYFLDWDWRDWRVMTKTTISVASHLRDAWRAKAHRPR
jgi:D-aspartate ligase